MDGVNLVFLYLTGSMGSCVGVLVLLYNLISVVLYLREETEGRSSGVAIAAWAIGVLATLIWWLPCVGGLAALLAVLVARMERGRIYRDQAPLAGATPVRMAHGNGNIALVLHSILMFSLLASWLLGT
jgi:hypothetical protein